MRDAVRNKRGGNGSVRLPKIPVLTCFVSRSCMVSIWRARSKATESLSGNVPTVVSSAI